MRDAPSTLSRVRPDLASGTPCNCHGSSAEMSERTAARRACSRSIASASVSGSSSRTRSAPSDDPARSEIRERVRGNSMTLSACEFMVQLLLSKTAARVAVRIVAASRRLRAPSCLCHTPE